MGIVITRYDDAENNNVQFDVSKYDYSYTEDGVNASDLATDFDNTLREIGTSYAIEKQTTTEGTMGNVTDVEETSRRIYAYIEDITKKDREIHEMGLAVSGNSKIFIKPTYSVKSGGVETEYVVAEDDILKDANSVSWRVIKIVYEREVNGTVIFKVGVVQNLDLEGTDED